MYRAAERTERASANLMGMHSSLGFIVIRTVFTAEHNRRSVRVLPHVGLVRAGWHPWMLPNPGRAKGGTMQRMVEAELRQLREEIEACRNCPLADTSPRVVFGEGNPCSPMVVVGEGPGEREEEEGRPFAGRAGALLNRLLAAAGLQREELWITNVLKRRAVKLVDGKVSNRPPTADEVAVYRKYLERELQIISPRIVLCLGNVAANALVHPNFKMTREHGVWFTSPEGRKLMATFHPAYILRSKGEHREELLRQTMEDFAAAAEVYKAIRGQAMKSHFGADARAG